MKRCSLECDGRPSARATAFRAARSAALHGTRSSSQRMSNSWKTTLSMHRHPQGEASGRAAIDMPETARPTQFRDYPGPLPSSNSQLPSPISPNLVLAAVRGEPTPRVPTGPLAVHFCAGLAGATLREYSTSASVLADSVLRYHARFRPDAVWLSADTWVSAEAMGARIGASDDHQPLGGVGGPLVTTAADLDRLPPPDVSRQGRYPLMVDAMRRLKAALGPDTCVVACLDQYPFSLAAALMGLDAIMVRLADDLSFVQALMDRCEAYAVAYGRALSEAGADILSGGDSPAGLLGPALYEAVALPAERRVIHALRAATDKPVALHICGKPPAFCR